MRHFHLILGLAAVTLNPVIAGQGDDHKGEVTFIKDPRSAPDAERQRALRQGPAWQALLAVHGDWFVEFNEHSATPHRAYGKPIGVAGGSPEDKAMNFLSQELNAFQLPMNEVQHTGTFVTGKHTFVHFAQEHQGLDVLFAKAMVKLDEQGRVISFGADMYAGIDISLIPSLPVSSALSAAEAGLNGIISSQVQPEMAILPLPVTHSVDHRLVFQVQVNTQEGNEPGRFLCLVDAISGELLYRHNKVVNHVPPPVGAEITVNGDVYEEHPYIPAVNMPLAHVEVVVNGSTMNVDELGYLNTGTVGPVSATVRLKGPWSTVRTGSTTPSFTTTLQEGTNTVSFNTNANIRERSAYYHVNIVHDHMKFWLPTFTGMDFSLETNVDVSGNCNAFYDGSSINFYQEGNDCQSYATIGEVVYHEYGHGINDNFYQSLGSNFSNGAMNEGYADIWGLSITEDPILAEGSSLSDPLSNIRRYDQNPKVYPSDITGEVHADGEIIAGAWWDTYVLLGNDMNAMMTLFIDAFPGLQANTFNGNEGEAFRDVLVDALQAVDNDGDLSNGTPNSAAIVEAFGIHGISLLSNAELNHTALQSAPQDAGITITAEVILDLQFLGFLDDVKLFYRVNDATTWNTVSMTNIGGNDYEGTIPSQPIGTVVAYYLGISDSFQQLSAVRPIGAALPDPNVPYYILVGYDLKATGDMDNVNELGDWTAGLPTDNATTGQWILNIPIGSFGTPGDPSTIVQTDEQHTPGGEFCFLTGNAANSSSALGENDVDGGTTTLLGDPIDISAYDNPTFTYYRWYINNPPSGANPGADWWQTFIRANNGPWVPLEETKTSDRSWRRYAFRVQDHVAIGGTIQLKFNVSDSIRMGQNLDGGSLVEGALDDLQLWDNAEIIGIEEQSAPVLNAVYPAPANDRLNVEFEIREGSSAQLQILDAVGHVIMEQRVNGSGIQRTVLDVGSYAAGSYVLRANTATGSAENRFQIVR